MTRYKVRSGQNIYDVALTLYGSVEGIFDLLACNDWLNMDTRLVYGMELYYHDGYLINRDLPLWFEDNNIIVKNGEHIFEYRSISDRAVEYIESRHPEKLAEMQAMSPDEQNMFWESIYTPRIVVKQQGQLSGFRVKLNGETPMLIDWGDYTDVQFVEGGKERLVEHCYKSAGSHTITLYGASDFELLDISDINGTHYPLCGIRVADFKSRVKNDSLNKLIEIR